MIDVTVRTDAHGRPRAVAVRGHALFSGYGSDVVCAGVSALCIGIANGIERYGSGDPEIRVDDRGLVSISLTGGADEDVVSDALLGTLIDGLVAIAGEYPRNVRVRYCEEGRA